jgi:hypothetical protein
MLEWLTKWEPLWLFIILTGELVVGLYSAWILTVEYWYDKSFNDAMKAARRDRRRKKYEFENLTDGEMK